MSRCSNRITSRSHFGSIRNAFRIMDQICSICLEPVGPSIFAFFRKCQHGVHILCLPVGTSLPCPECRAAWTTEDDQRLAATVRERGALMPPRRVLENVLASPPRQMESLEVPREYIPACDCRAGWEEPMTYVPHNGIDEWCCLSCNATM